MTANGSNEPSSSRFMKGKNLHEATNRRGSRGMEMNDRL